MEEYKVHLTKDEIDTLRLSHINDLIPIDGTIESALLRGVMSQILDREDE